MIVVILTFESSRTVAVNVKKSRMWLVASRTHFTGEKAFPRRATGTMVGMWHSWIRQAWTRPGKREWAAELASGTCWAVVSPTPFL